tara:strand:- start:158 stop:508 length:351 start_codon:yes stop_codon:yes gene_type:complete
MMRTVSKPWGKEEWLILNDKYCVKRLYINEGESTSLQYHEVKKETMFLESGVCDLVLHSGNTVKMQYHTPYTIHPKDIHRLISYRSTVILEVSTPEVDDVIRIQDNYGREKGYKKD